MSRINLKACSEILHTVKVSAFHLEPVVCVGLAAWLKRAGVNHFSVKASVAELLNSGEAEILLLDVESILDFDASSLQRLERSCAARTIVVTTAEQLDRLGGRVPRSIGSLIPPCGAFEDFIQAILAVTKQSTYVDPSLSATWNRVLADPGFKLTTRQLQILRLVAKGKTSVQIAAELGLRPKTVENHRAAIKERMGVVSSAEMINEAHKRGYC